MTTSAIKQHMIQSFPGLSRLNDFLEIAEEQYSQTRFENVEITRTYLQGTLGPYHVTCTGHFPNAPYSFPLNSQDIAPSARLSELAIFDGNSLLIAVSISSGRLTFHFGSVALVFSGTFSDRLADLKCLSHRWQDSEFQTQADYFAIIPSGEYSDSVVPDIPVKEHPQLWRAVLQNPIAKKFFCAIERTVFGNTPKITEESDLDDEIIVNYRQNGIVLWPSALDASTLSALQKSVQQKEDAGEGFALGDSDWENDTQVVHWYKFDDADPLYVKISRSPRVLSAVRKLSGLDVFPVTHYVKRVSPGSQAAKLTNESWHSDGVGISNIRIIYYLADVLNENDGPFSYKLGTHAGSNDGPIFSALSPAGSGLFADVTGLHRATRPFHHDRLTLQILYWTPMADHLNYMMAFTGLNNKR